MARDTFDFDAVAAKLTDGGFYHSAGDAQGTMMIAWGRRGRNKFVQLSQPEIGNFLAHGASMLRTDDPDITGALQQLARALAATRVLTIDEVFADQALSARLVELLGTGLDKDEALKALSRELAGAKAQTVKAARKTA